MAKLADLLKGVGKLEGKGTWLRCFAHILNLVVKSITRAFDKSDNEDDDDGAPIEEELTAEEVQFGFVLRPSFCFSDLCS